MVNYIKTNAGTPAAFHDDNYIYDLQGRAVGKLRGAQVYCLAGHYVGELQNGVILDKRSQEREHTLTRCRHQRYKRPMQSNVR